MGRFALTLGLAFALAGCFEVVDVNPQLEVDEDTGSADSGPDVIPCFGDRPPLDLSPSDGVHRARVCPGDRPHIYDVTYTSDIALLAVSPDTPEVEAGVTGVPALPDLDAPERSNAVTHLLSRDGQGYQIRVELSLGSVYSIEVFNCGGTPVVCQ